MLSLPVSKYAIAAVIVGVSMGAGAKVFLGSAELGAMAATMGKLPTVAEYFEAFNAKIAPRLDKVYRSRELARGNEILFAATGISDGPLLRGVEVHGTTAITHSILMRAKSGTVRYLSSEHNLEKKTIHLRSSVNEVPI